MHVYDRRSLFWRILSKGGSCKTDDGHDCDPCKNELVFHEDLPARLSSGALLRILESPLRVASHAKIAHRPWTDASNFPYRAK